MQAALAQVLVDCALGDADAVAGEQDRSDLRGRASWQLGAERAGLVKQLRMASHRSEIRPRLWFEPAQTLLAIGADPTVERAAGVLTLAAIRMLIDPAR